MLERKIVTNTYTNRVMRVVVNVALVRRFGTTKHLYLYDLDNKRQAVIDFD